MFKNARILKIWVVIFILVPIILMVLSAVTTYSVLGYEGFRIEFDAFNVFNSDVFLRALLNSLKFAGLVTFFTFLLGYPAAYFLSRSQSPY